MREGPWPGRYRRAAGFTAAAVALVCWLAAAATAATSFGEARLYETSAAADVAAGDVDGDGILDLVGGDYGEIAVLLDNGDGTFQLDEQPIPDPNYYVRRLALADVDQDETLDLVLTDPLDNEVIVMGGDGAGGFVLDNRIDIVGTPSGVAVGEFGGGAEPDVAVTDIEDNEVTLLIQEPDGDFVAGPSFAVEDEPHQLGSADLDGNGRRDLVVSNEESDTVTVLLQEEDGFASPASHEVGAGPSDVEIVDMDGNGMLDIVVATTTSVTVLRAVAPGAFDTYEEHYASAYVGTVKADDLDDDGDKDLVLGTSSPAVRVMVQSPEGSYESIPAGDFSSYVVYGTAIGDFNGDGEIDFAASDALEGFHVLLGDVLRMEPPWVEFGPTWGGRWNLNGAFTVRNSGSAPIMVEEVAFDGPEGPFSLNPDSCIGVMLAVRDTCQVGVGVKAQTGVNSTLTAWIRVRAGNVVRRVWADADVYEPGNLQADPPSVDFGAVPVGSVSGQRTVIVRNPGTTAVTTGPSPGTTGPFRVVSNGCSGRVLEPSATCRITAEFVPTVAGRPTESGRIVLFGREALSDLSAYVAISLRGQVPRATRTPRTRPNVVPRSQLDRKELQLRLRTLASRVPQLLVNVPRSKRVLPRFGAPETGELAMVVRARAGKRNVVLAQVKARVQKGQHRRLTFRLSRRVRSILRQSTASRVRVRLSFRPDVQPLVRVDRTFVLKRPAS